MMKRLLSYLFMLSVLFSFSSCKKDDAKREEPQTYSRAVLFYIVSENSLNGICNGDVSEVLAAKSSLADDEEIVLYVDNTSTPAIYLINNKTEASIFSELQPVYSYEEDHNSCSRESLVDFLDYVKKYYPADSYGMVFESHGSGWIPSSYSGDTQTFANRRRSFGIDNGKNSTSNVGNQMCISDLHTALQSFGKTFEYLMFDACFMQCVEVDYELRDVTKYVIGSPAEIPGYGANYTTLVPALFSKTNYAYEIPHNYYSTYESHTAYGVLISSVETSKLDALAEATKNMIVGHRDELLNMSYDGILNYYVFKNNGEERPDYYDMNAIFKSLLQESEYKAWKQCFDEAVPYSYATDFWTTCLMHPDRQTVDHSQYGGVSMFVPLDKYMTGYYAQFYQFFVDGYYQSQWAKKVWK